MEGYQLIRTWISPDPVPREASIEVVRGDVESPTGRRAHALLWAGEDVRYLHRPGQIIPDPAPLYAHEPKTGQLLSEFPDVFPMAWAP